MNKQELQSALRQVADGSLSPEEMLVKLKSAPFGDIGVANIDFHRSIRQGAGEAAYKNRYLAERVPMEEI